MAKSKTKVEKKELSPSQRKRLATIKRNKALKEKEAAKQEQVVDLAAIVNHAVEDVFRKHMNDQQLSVSQPQLAKVVGLTDTAPPPAQLPVMEEFINQIQGLTHIARTVDELLTNFMIRVGGMDFAYEDSRSGVEPCGNNQEPANLIDHTELAITHLRNALDRTLSRANRLYKLA